MKNIKLNPTGVILDDTHRYWAEGKELHGITGLIKRHVFPDMYEGVLEKVLDAKKKYGTMVAAGARLVHAAAARHPGRHRR